MYSRLSPLAVGTFAVGIPTFVTAGLVGTIANDLGVTASAAGQIATVYGIAYAILSTILAAVTASFSRKAVLVAGLIIYSAGAVLTAVAGNLGLLFATLIVMAAGGALFTPAAAATAAALAPPDRRGRALALVIGGSTVATAVGAPAGTLVSDYFDWRAAFWMIAILGVVALLVVAFLIPDVRLTLPRGIRERVAPLTDRKVLPILATQFLAFAAGFTTYPYLSLVAGPATGGAHTSLSLLIWTFGLGAVVGNAVAGRLTDALGPRPMVFTSLIGITMVGVLTQAAMSTMASAMILLAAWSLTGWAIGAGQQLRLVSAAPDRTPVTLGLLVSVQFAGVAAGGLLGGLGLAWLGAGSLGWISASVGFVAIIFTVLTYRPERTRDPVLQAT